MSRATQRLWTGNPSLQKRTVNSIQKYLVLTHFSKLENSIDNRSTSNQNRTKNKDLLYGDRIKPIHLSEIIN